jgi:hypothetical protein
LDKFAEPLEPDKFVLEARETRVQAARIRQYEYVCARDRLLLESRSDTRCTAKQSPIDRHADKCDDLRIRSSNFGDECARAAIHLVSRQVRGGSSCTRAEIRERQSEFRKSRITFVFQLDWNETRREKEAPEWISWSGKMMSDLLRANARVDSNQQDSRAISDDVAQTSHFSATSGGSIRIQ